MTVQRAAPHPELSGLVRHYQSRITDVALPQRRVALPARTAVLLEFYFTAPHLLELQSTREVERAPLVAAVGPQTFRRVDLLLAGRMDIFTITFTPIGIHALLGVPMSELTDAGIDAAALFGGTAIAALRERLAEAPDLASRARLADAFLLMRRSRQPRPAEDGIVAAALGRMQRSAGSDPTRVLAAASSISERHFRRLFEEQVGIAPKRYARIVRLEAALAAKAASPDTGWTAIAHDLGWFDQAHMDKDFRALAGAAPSRFDPAKPAR